tara:strand:- start:1327 stop:1578 length:252 start_codon:yes stop_codon:yes gene_type:complete
MLDIILTTGSVFVLSLCVFFFLYSCGDEKDWIDGEYLTQSTTKRLVQGIKNFSLMLGAVALMAGMVVLPVAALVYLVGGFNGG